MIQQAARHKYGCRIIQRLLECGPQDQVRDLIDCLLEDAINICAHPYGNYVIQNLLDQSTREQRRRLLQSLMDNVTLVGNESDNVYVSAVMVKIMSVAQREEKVQLARSLLRVPGLLRKMGTTRHGHQAAKKVLKTLTGSEHEDVPLDSSLGSQFLSSLRISQMKNQQLTSEQVDLLRSIVETAQGILGSQKPLPEASEEGEETEATEPAVEALAVKAPAVEAAEIAAAPVAPPAFVPPRRSVAKVKIQEGSETVDFPAESKAHGEKIQRSHSEPPEVAASLEKAPTALKHFMDARSVSEIAEGFRYLLKCVELHQDETGASHSPEALPYQKIKSLPGLPWKAQQVWQLLDGQLKKEDCKAKPLRGKSVAVVGAGPVGLRIALQLKLAGASVTVLEKRCEFVRINRLHLWDWVKQDLIQWGAKVFSPPGGTFGADKDYCHIGISELQYLLLKCCLLMGVTVELGVSFRDTNYRAGQGWVALTDPALVPQELVVDALVCCDGAASRIAKSKGAVTIAGGLGKEGQAIGVVANFMNGKSPAERNLRQFSWARQFNGPLFKTLKDKVGAELQNIVYYRGDENHYMIMTPSKQCLVEKGCLHTAETLDGAALLRADNVELDNLKTLAQEVAVHFGVPSEFTPEQSVMIFDFSDTKRHEQAMLFQEADAGSGVPLAITMAGDALLEPFWPTGLGCIRAFLGAMDAVSCLSTWFVTKDREQALSKAEAAYRQLKSVDAQTKDMKASGVWSQARVIVTCDVGSRYLLDPSLQ